MGRAGTGQDAAAGADTGSRPGKGIALKILHVLLVTTMLAVVKAIHGLPVTEIMFFRAFIALVLIAIYLRWRGELIESIRTSRPFGHLLRAVLSMTTTGLTFVAVQSLPLPDAVTLQYTQPLFVVAFSAVLLGESVRLFRWIAVAVGFTGALVISWPKLTLLTGGAGLLTQSETIGVIAAIAGAATFAANILVVGQLVRTESSATISLWLGIYSSAALALTMPFGWVMPDAGQFGLLLLIGAIGGGILIALSESLRAAPASTLAPFEYASLIFAALLGYVMFGEVLELNTLIGSLILIVSGLAILWRERSLGRGGRATAPGVPKV
ncbi:EamA family transporter [Rhodobacterales bacterium HKCCE2091]|nr:EamA family transporter [Rhodobacterales bacterium HKCCE2091]